MLFCKRVLGVLGWSTADMPDAAHLWEIKLPVDIPDIYSRPYPSMLPASIEAQKSRGVQERAANPGSPNDCMQGRL
jgi:hypothetical protein